MSKGFLSKYTFWKKIFLILSFIVISSIVVCGILFAVFLYEADKIQKAHDERHAKAKILAFLPNNNFQSNIAFNETVQQTYPVGSNAKKLVDELTEQGFSVNWEYIPNIMPRYNLDKTDNEYVKNTAYLYENNFICGTSWLVEWKNTEHGIITEINGSNSINCL